MAKSGIRNKGESNVCTVSRRNRVKEPAGADFVCACRDGRKYMGPRNSLSYSVMGLRRITKNSL